MSKGAVIVEIGCCLQQAMKPKECNEYVYKSDHT